MNDEDDSPDTLDLSAFVLPPTPLDIVPVTAVKMWIVYMPPPKQQKQEQKQKPQQEQEPLKTAHSTLDLRTPNLITQADLLHAIARAQTSGHGGYPFYNIRSIALYVPPPHLSTTPAYLPGFIRAPATELQRIDNLLQFKQLVIPPTIQYFHSLCTCVVVLTASP